VIMTMRNLLLVTAVVVGGCQVKRTDSVRDGMLASLGKSGREQTQTPHPSDQAQARYEPGAAGGEAAASPRPRQPLAAIQPMDLMTSLGDTPIEVTIVPRGTTVDDGFLKGLRSRIALATWPEMASVAFDVSISNETSPARFDNGAEVAPRAILRVVPAKPLDDRWYIVSLNAADLVELGPVQAQMKLPNGAVGSRFRTGSEPALWGVRFAGKGPNEMVVMVDFSERLPSATLRQINLAQVGDTGSICELVEPTAAQAQDLPTAKTVTFICRNMAPTAPIAVQFPDGVADRQTGPNRTLSLRSSDFRGRVDGQYEWHPTN
jgi:hypothetical protein